MQGGLQPGDQIPTEEALAQEHGVSRGTVRKALQLLIDEGFTESMQGRGSFVTDRAKKSTYFSLTSFEDEMRRQQRVPATRLLGFNQREAGGEIGRRLQIPPHQMIYEIERLRLADRVPVAFERRILAQSLCPMLPHEDLENQSIHWLLTHKYRIPLVKMVHTVERLPLTAEQAGLLQANQGDYAFAVDRLSFTVREGERVPAVLFTAVYREDSYYLRAIG